MKWLGDVAFGVGMVIFRGHAGDNRIHRHWAHQIVIGLNGEFELEGSDGLVRAEAAVIFSGAPHRLLPSKVLSIYLDPVNDIFQRLFTTAPEITTAQSITSKPPTEEIACLRKQELAPLCRLIASSATLDDLLVAIQTEFLNPASDSENRLAMVLARLNKAESEAHSEAKELSKHGIDRHEIGRNDLAKLLNLSPTRFSHWFREQTGVPLRSYKKWLKLRNGIDFVFAEQSLVEASLAAVFTDQAHFSRSFSQAFGITLTDAVEATGPII